MEEIKYENFSITIIDEIEDVKNDNVDVYIKIDENTVYVGSFFTLENIKKLMEKDKQTGECNNGMFFWASDMIIVEELTPQVLKETIEYLIAENWLPRVFTRIDPEN